MSNSAHQLGLFDEVVDPRAVDRTVARFQERNVLLPTLEQLADPTAVPEAIRARLTDIDPDSPDPQNLFRIHWYNDDTRAGMSTEPTYWEVPSQLTGLDARILVVIGDRFPLIRAHKVLAAYACLVPRIVSGAFDPTTHRAVWPSTGNYARGGVAISRIMGCRGVAVLPEGMSRERFDWLSRWVTEPEDIIRTPGTESNVKEIYDTCKQLAADPANVILNQFSEFGNYLAHYAVTGPALHRVFMEGGGGRLSAFVAASGSAGTLGAGDYLKERTGCRIVPVEALECATMLYNGYGEHNIQGIGDKHIPLIHNVANSDDVVGVSDRATDSLIVLFNTPEGRKHLVDLGVDPIDVDQLRHLGLSSICNVLASIKVAKYHGYGNDDVIVTVATDGADMYLSEVERITQRDYPDGYDDKAAAAAYARYLAAADTEHVLKLGERDRRRIFNLGYYTWVEQQGVGLDDFERRWHLDWWRQLRSLVARWDGMIEGFNQRTGVTPD